MYIPPLHIKSMESYLAIPIEEFADTIQADSLLDLKGSIRPGVGIADQVNRCLYIVRIYSARWDECVDKMGISTAKGLLKQVWKERLLHFGEPDGESDSKDLLFYSLMRRAAKYL